MKPKLKKVQVCLGCGKELPYKKLRKTCPYCGEILKAKVVLEDLRMQAEITRGIVNELIDMAKKLRAKAEALERESEKLKAAVARDLAEYLENTAAEFRR